MSSAGKICQSSLGYSSATENFELRLDLHFVFIFKIQFLVSLHNLSVCNLFDTNSCKLIEKDSDVALTLEGCVIQTLF